MHTLIYYFLLPLGVGLLIGPITMWTILWVVLKMKKKEIKL